MTRAKSRRRNSRSRNQAAPADSQAEQIQYAYRRPRAIIVFVIIVAAGVAADLATKHYAFAALIDQPRPIAEVIPGCFNLRLSTNPGVVFGLPLPPWLVLTATGLAVVAVGALFASSPRRAWGLHASLAIILAGAIGNAYDRIFSSVHFPAEIEARTHEVRDFIDMYVGKHHWPTYNVADIFLVVGVAVVLLHSLRKGARGGA